MAGAVVGDYGDNWLITIGYDFTGYSEITVHITKPDGTAVTKVTADGVTDNGDATAGVVKYPIESGLIGATDDGIWLGSVMITDANGIYSGPTPFQYTVRRRNQNS